MVKAHVTGFTGLRSLRFFNRKSVPGVTGIARSRAKLAAVLAQFRDVIRRLHADLVTPAAALFSLNHRHRLPMDRGHSQHSRPGLGMLPVHVLLNLRLVTLCAGFGRRDFHLGNVGRRLMLIAVTSGARYVHLAVLAQLPISHDARRLLAVTLNAGRIGVGRWLGKCCESQSQTRCY